MRAIRKCLSSMEREPRYGKMAQSTKATGVMAWPRGKAISTTPMAMSTPVNFTKIEPMALEFMFIRMAKRMKVSGETTCRTDQEKRS